MKNLSSFLLSSLSAFTYPCDVYSKAGQSKLPFPTSTISAKSNFELIHKDTWGPYKTTTHDGYKYFLTIVDNFIMSAWTYLLKTKGNAFTVLKYIFGFS